MQTVTTTHEQAFDSPILNGSPCRLKTSRDCTSIDAVFGCHSVRELIRQLLEYQAEFTTAAAFYFHKEIGADDSATERILPSECDTSCDGFLRTLAAASLSSQRTQTTEVRRLASPTRTAVAVQVATDRQSSDTLGLLFNGAPCERELRQFVELLSARVSLWHQLSRLRELDSFVTDASAIIELLEIVVASANKKHAGIALVAALQAYLKCAIVVLGLKSTESQSCRLVAISGNAQFHAQSELTQSYEAAFSEAIQRDQVVCWSTANEQNIAPELARVCSSTGSLLGRCLPLHTSTGQVVGALLLLDSTDSSTSSNPSDSTRFLLAAERPIATALWQTGRRLPFHPRLLVEQWSKAANSARARTVLATACLACVLLVLPLSHRIHCRCQIEPVISRFVAAPFEGTLEKTLVKPGQIVKCGDILARIDGREIHWKRAALLADLNQATKKRDAAQVAHNYTEQQISQLETQRLTTEIELLDHRAENLEITSPVDGIIASGDLERVEGVPLSLGQTLFEIAPLEKMIVEISIPDTEIQRVASGKLVQFRLDAFSSETWQAQIARIHPRAEIRDEENVFIAEAEFDNRDGKLRPGMKGRARIAGDRHSIAWILFHQPYEFLLKRLSW